ncbi:ECF-type sigma factor [Dokdonella sp.]|uniref:ECF-type sigma factor n=1 Tax=Dokdonella sp. TaxID=2291710 RepID=UPI002634A04B|nr:ECF-type sigma factor [Dokdonella sp.]
MRDGPSTPSFAPDYDLTRLLHAWRNGDGCAFTAAIEQVYAELRRIAARRIGRHGDAATLSPTELVHEAVLGLWPAPMDFDNRAHFLATVSLAMRAILVDHARARAADKRGGNRLRLSLSRLDDADTGDDTDAALDLLSLEQALEQLESLDARCGRIMHLTYFGGLSQEEIAALLNVSVPTVKRDLRFARAWLLKILGEGT